MVWCWVTRPPQIFRWLTGCQRTPGIEVSQYLLISTLFLVLLSNNCCIYFYFYSLHHVIGEKIKLKKSYIVNKDWINLQFSDPVFLKSIESFLSFARKNLPGRQTILCLCKQCGNQRLPSIYDEVKYDLVKYGFISTYKVWDLHGENIPANTNEQGHAF